MSKEYLKEMRALELQEKKLRDRYNTEEKSRDIHDYKRIVSAKIKIAPIGGEKLSDYVKRLIVYQNLAKEKNWETHVDNPYKTWHTHKNPLGCFMCEDTQFIGVTIQVLQVIADTYPEYTF